MDNPNTLADRPLSNVPLADVANDPLAGMDEYAFGNWDGEGALPIEAASVAAARAVLGLLPTGLSEPDIAPGADGTIGLEWRSPYEGALRLTLVEVGPGTKVTANIWTPDSVETTSWPAPSLIPADAWTFCLQFVERAAR